MGLGCYVLVTDAPPDLAAAAQSEAAFRAFDWRAYVRQGPIGSQLANLTFAESAVVTQNENLFHRARMTGDLRLPTAQGNATFIQLTAVRSGRAFDLLCLAGTAIYAQHGDGRRVYLIGLNVRYYEDLVFQAAPPQPRNGAPE